MEKTANLQLQQKDNALEGAASSDKLISWTDSDAITIWWISAKFTHIKSTNILEWQMLQIWLAETCKEYYDQYH